MSRINNPKTRLFIAAEDRTPSDMQRETLELKALLLTALEDNFNSSKEIQIEDDGEFFNIIPSIWKREAIEQVQAVDQIKDEKEALDYIHQCAKHIHNAYGELKCNG